LLLLHFTALRSPVLPGVALPTAPFVCRFVIGVLRSTFGVLLYWLCAVPLWWIAESEPLLVAGLRPDALSLMMFSV
jgi:hypothetical protein